MINENWSRWIKASIVKHFVDTLTATAPVFVEGTDRTTATQEDFFEVRLEGPRIKEQTKNNYVLTVLPNIAIQAKLDDVDAYKMQRLMGKVQSIFPKSLAVNRYGDGPPDDGTLLGCLDIIGELRSNYFGQIDNVLRIEQATIEGDFNIYLIGS